MQQSLTTILIEALWIPRALAWLSRRRSRRHCNEYHPRALAWLSRRRSRRHCNEYHQHYERHRHDASQRSLYKQPAELLAIINQHLDSAEDSFALAFTCARFYYSDSLKDIVLNKASRFKYLCKLEEKHGGEKEGYCCQGCLVRHPSSAVFSENELEKAPSERYCLETQPCLKFGIFPSLSFKDVKNLVLAVGEAKMRQYNQFGEQYSSPEITIESSLRLFPISACITRSGFGIMCRNIDYPLCPHLQLGEALDCALFPSLLTTTGTEFVEGWPGKSYQCKLCKTHVSFEILPADMPGNNSQKWCALNLSRSVGRLHSPLEPDWLAQSFAHKYPHVDQYNRVNDDWFRTYWGNSSPSRSRSVPGFDLSKCAGGIRSSTSNACPSCDPIYLPTTRASLEERRRVRAWLAASNRIPEEIHRKYGPPHTIKIITWNGMLAVEGK